MYILALFIYVLSKMSTVVNRNKNCIFLIFHKAISENKINFGLRKNINNFLKNRLFTKLLKIPTVLGGVSRTSAVQILWRRRTRNGKAWCKCSCADQNQLTSSLRYRIESHRISVEKRSEYRITFKGAHLPLSSPLLHLYVVLSPLYQYLYL